jgi:hypothetical protein
MTAPVFGIFAGAMLAVSIVAGLVPLVVGKGKIRATQAGGEKALERLSDWAKWMTGIETATFAALGVILEKRPAVAHGFPAICTIVFLGASLFCSAWVLSSIANVGLAVTATTRGEVASDGRSKAFDVYERPLYAGFAKQKGGRWLRRLTLNYMVTLLHGLWALGLFFFALFLLTALQEDAPAPSPARTTREARPSEPRSTPGEERISWRSDGLDANHDP